MALGPGGLQHPLVREPAPVSATSRQRLDKRGGSHGERVKPLAPQKLRSGADPASLEAAARMLIEAKRPLLYAGHGVLIAEASPEPGYEEIYTDIYV
jgi:catalase (peroxidase I)